MQQASPNLCALLDHLVAIGEETSGVDMEAEFRQMQCRNLDMTGTRVQLAWNTLVQSQVVLVTGPQVRCVAILTSPIPESQPVMKMAPSTFSRP